MSDDPDRTTDRDIRDQAREAGSRLADDARNTAHSAASQASNYANDRVHEARDGVASEVSDVAQALRKAAESTRDGSLQEQAFQILAGSLDDTAESMKHKEPGDLLSDVNRFARRNPLAFLGVAALAGFAVSRVAGASANRRHSDYDDDYGSHYNTGASARRPGAVPTAAPRPAGVTPGTPGSASTAGSAGTAGTGSTGGPLGSASTAGTAGSATTVGTTGTYNDPKKGGL